MQVTLDKQYPVAASVEAAWAVLSNIHELATCMSGAQITEEIDPSHYKGSVRVKVGPAVAAFAGTIEVLSLSPDDYTLKMVGKGTDKGGSSASMELTAKLLKAEDGGCLLEGHAEVIVTGKFAQLGGRMMTSVSDMVLAQFADTFSQKAQAVQGAMASTAEGLSSTTATVAATPVVAKEFNALGLVWALIRDFFAKLFGRKS